MVVESLLLLTDNTKTWKVFCESVATSLEKSKASLHPKPSSVQWMSPCPIWIGLEPQEPISPA